MFTDNYNSIFFSESCHCCQIEDHIWYLFGKLLNCESICHSSSKFRSACNLYIVFIYESKHIRRCKSSYDYINTYIHTPWPLYDLQVFVASFSLYLEDSLINIYVNWSHETKNSLPASMFHLPSHKEWIICSIGTKETPAPGMTGIH